MSSFIDDFYNDDMHNLNKFKAILKVIPNIQEDYDNFIIHFKDLEASINHQVHLTTLDAYIPIRDINIMIERESCGRFVCVQIRHLQSL